MEDRRDVLDVLLGSLDDTDRVRTLGLIQANHAAQLKIIHGSASMPGHPPRPGRSGTHPRRDSPAHSAARIRIFTSYREQVTTIYVYVYDAAEFAAAFRAALDHGMHTGQPLLVVDLDGVSFLDPAGLEVLRRAAAQAVRRGKRISVRRADPTVYQTIVDAGLVATLDVHPARANSQGKRTPKERGAS
jgi:anti-anti-sigma factor